MAYFQRTGDNEFTATEHTGGAWNPKEQHIAPMVGLMTHLTELDHSQRDAANNMVPGRISVEILGTISFDPFHIDIEVVRPGRTIELVEAICVQNGRPAARMRTWFLIQEDTLAFEGTAFEDMPEPTGELRPGLGIGWGGGFVNSIAGYQEMKEPGRGIAWWQTDVPLLEGETVSNLASYMSILDMANGVAVRENPQEVVFPNLDLTAHLFRMPEGKWVGTDTSVSFGGSGVGLTHSILHDEAGPIGTCSQVLTVRPRK